MSASSPCSTRYLGQMGDGSIDDHTALSGLWALESDWMEAKVRSLGQPAGSGVELGLGGAVRRGLIGWAGYVDCEQTGREGEAASAPRPDKQSGPSRFQQGDPGLPCTPLHTPAHPGRSRTSLPHWAKCQPLRPAALCEVPRHVPEAPSFPPDTSPHTPSPLPN